MKDSRIAADRGGRASYPTCFRFDPVIPITPESSIRASEVPDQKRLEVETW
jgi:hypothetical protein